VEARHLLAVMAGGSLGALARYALGLWALKRFGPAFPWGTLAINLAGCLALGLFAGLRLGGRHAVPELLHPAFAVGFLGAYTTFSTFGLEVVLLLEGGRWGAAAGYVASSVGAGIAAAALGLYIGRQL
jgi:fluoride exporter